MYENHVNLIHVTASNIMLDSHVDMVVGKAKTLLTRKIFDLIIYSNLVDDPPP